MKKDTEIKILEQIEELLMKLYRGDTYFRDDVKDHLDQGDITQIINNIKSDFPFFHQTLFLEKLIRSHIIYKKRCNLLADMVRRKDFSLKAYENTINDLEEKYSTMLKQQNNVAQQVVRMSNTDHTGERDHYQEQLLDLFPYELLISIKLENDIPLTEYEKKKVKNALTFNG